MEHQNYANSVKEYIKKSENSLEQAKKDEEELKSLKIFMEKSQEQLKLLTEENDKNININNELKEKISELEKELEDSKASKETLAQSQSDIESKIKSVEQYQIELKKKEDLILNYEKKFDDLEESEQQAYEKQKNAEEKATKFEKTMEKMKKEMDEIRKENENLAFERATENNLFSQERLDFKKAVQISEKTIVHLNKEKTSLETKIIDLQNKLDKAAKKLQTKEIQTDISGSISDNKSGENPENDALTKIKTKLLQKEEELHTANQYSSSLLQEVKKLQEKIAELQENSTNFEKKFTEQTQKLTNLETINQKLISENAELKKRREMAVMEITKLTEQISRKGGVAKPKDAPRHMSEAVISTSAQQAKKSLTPEQELIMYTKKELDVLYKELIRSIFRDPKDSIFHFRFY